MGTTDWRGAGAGIGDYVIERQVAAKHGFVAWSASHSLLPRRARISTVHPAFRSHPANAAQLVREACILEALRHAGVPRVFECGELADGRPWVASELIEGPSLAVLLAEEGKLGVAMVLALLAGVAEILHYAHTRGLVHRNLHPQAIASRAEGGPCIVDWSDARPREGEVPGAAPSDYRAYQAPEVIGGEPADSRADVFALGVIAHEALLGAKPGPGVSLRRWPAVPGRLAALLERMLAPDPLVRPTSAEVRAEALAIVEQVEILPADEDGAEVQIVDVELGAGLAHEVGLDGPPAAMPEGSLSWAAQDVDELARTRTMPAEAQAGPAQAGPAQAAPAQAAPAPPHPHPIDTSRTLTESMMPEHLTLSRTETEPMLGPPDLRAEPRSGDAKPVELRMSRTPTRIGGKTDGPSRASGPSGKTT